MLHETSSKPDDLLNAACYGSVGLRGKTNTNVYVKIICVCLSLKPVYEFTAKGSFLVNAILKISKHFG